MGCEGNRSDRVRKEAFEDCVDGDDLSPDEKYIMRNLLRKHAHLFADDSISLDINLWNRNKTNYLSNN